MRSRSVVVPFIASLIAVPMVFGLAMLVRGPAEGDKVTLGLFGATVLVELLALTRVFAARRVFSSGDSGHLTWTLIGAFLVVRLLGETRLATISFQLVPRYSEGVSSGLFIYIIVFRYLYTLSDVLFILALTSTIRAYQSTGLRFGMIKRDYLYILLVWTMPVVTFVFRENLFYSNTAGSDRFILTFRLITVTV